MPLINTHADVDSEVRGLNVGLSLYLHAYFVYASSKASGGSAHMHRLALASLLASEMRYVPKARIMTRVFFCFVIVIPWVVRLYEEIIHEL